MRKAGTAPGWVGAFPRHLPRARQEARLFRGRAPQATGPARWLFPLFFQVSFPNSQAPRLLKGQCFAAWARAEREGEGRAQTPVQSLGRKGGMRRHFLQTRCRGQPHFLERIQEKGSHLLISPSLLSPSSTHCVPGVERGGRAVAVIQTGKNEEDWSPSSCLLLSRHGPCWNTAQMASTWNVVPSRGIQGHAWASRPTDCFG